MSRPLALSGMQPAPPVGMDRQRDHDDEPTQPIEPVDEPAYGGSSAETGGLYDEDGPTAVNVEGDTMGSRDEAEPGDEAKSDPYSG
jgi:hypothetical protein